MKKLITFSVCVLFSLFSFGQAPQKMSYQAVIRSTMNKLVTSRAVGMKISILQTSATGTTVYSETQTPSTNSNGLVSLQIGEGLPIIGTFRAINWANGPYFIKTETDPDGASSYSITGTSQLMSVPYALYAASSGSTLPGPQGAQGIPGLNGIRGLTGAIGLTGVTGLTGSTGIAGTNGTNGINGTNGLTGIAGANGTNGINGTNGLTGASGVQGPIGLSGTTAIPTLASVLAISNSANSSQIKYILNPTEAQDAVTKSYLENTISVLQEQIIALQNRISPTVTPIIGNYSYTGVAQGPTAANNSGSSLIYTFSYSGVSPTVYATSAIPPTNVGIYTVTATVLAVANYSSVSSAATTFIIQAATPIVSPIVGSYVYTGLGQGPSFASNSGNGLVYAFSYVGLSPTVYAASAVPPINAGVYTVTATVLATNNYISASSVATSFTIGKASPIVIPTVGSYTYTGASQGPTTATNSGSCLSYTFSYVGVSPTVYVASVIPPSNVGIYTVTATVSAMGNYTGASSVPTSFAIAVAMVSLPSIPIGLQIWSTKNLEVTAYSDGTTIPQVTDPAVWATLTTGAWCYYNNDAVLGTSYGKLYNWYAVAGIYDAASLTNLSLRKQLAPSGWHVPTDSEWTVLTNNLGGEAVAGGAMKETSTTHWMSPNTSAANTVGFTALPGGFRNNNGTFYYSNSFGYWWSATECTVPYAWFRCLYYNYGNVNRNNVSKGFGFSVRCLKD